MNVIAQTALKYNEIKILTFELMGNHLHILAEGPKEQVLASFSFIRKRLGRGLKDCFPDSLPKGFAPSLKEVTSLDAMRNTIVYINRNGFVADAHHTPYSYPCSKLFIRSFALPRNDISRHDYKATLQHVPWPNSGHSRWLAHGIGGLFDTDRILCHTIRIIHVP